MKFLRTPFFQSTSGVCFWNFSFYRSCPLKRLISSFLNVETNGFNLVNCFWFFKLPSTAFATTQISHFLFLMTISSHVSWRYWSMMKFEASIGQNWFFYVDWLISTDTMIQTDLMIWLVNQITLEGKHLVRSWLVRAQFLHILWYPVHIFSKICERNSSDADTGGVL